MMRAALCFLAAVDSSGDRGRAMLLRTLVRDCLYLNWAVPVGRMPEPPAPLRYERHSTAGEDHVFVSALLFRQEGLRLPSFPLVSVSYPQFNLRVCVRDAEGVPSVLFLHVLVPAWAVPGVRVVGRQRAAAGRFSYPRCSDGPPGAPWRWTVRAGESLAVSATVAAPGSPGGGTEPRFRRFEDLVDTLRNRTRAYSVGRGGLVRVKTSHPPVTVVPVAAQVECDSLLRRFGPAGEWPPLHSAWLCPEIRFVFELSAAGEMALPRQAPAPV
jgi:hypothetical protein